MLSQRALRRLVSAVVLTMATAAPMHAASAGPDDADAEALIGKGIELREKGKDDEALTFFKRALARSPTPRARAQVALAEQALGLWVSAESDLMTALAASDDAWITKNHAALDGALATVRRHIGSLEVRGTEGADVTLDGVKLGTLPASAPYHVEAGRRTLELRAKGFYPTTRAVEIPAGGVARETVTLVVMPPDASAIIAQSNPPPRSSDPGDKQPSQNVHDTSDPGHTQRLVGWVLAGAGAALLVTGGIGFIVRKGLIDDYNADSSCPGQNVPTQPMDCQNQIDSVHTWLVVSITSLIAGGVLAVGGVTLVASAPSRPSRAATAGLHQGLDLACAPRAGSNGAALFCSGSF